MIIYSTKEIIIDKSKDWPGRTIPVSDGTSRIGGLMIENPSDYYAVITSTTTNKIFVKILKIENDELLSEIRSLQQGR